MNNGNVSCEDARARRKDDFYDRHTRAGGYPDSRQANIQQAVGQLAGRFYLRFMQGALAQTIGSTKVQQPAALFSTVHIGGRV
jgi:hypothetical protein